jgi:Sulfotransferase family
MPYCITGMHRSGTSMVARALNLCGLYLGEPEQIRRFGDDNVEGYWENDDFVDLNERLLAAQRAAWDMPFREEPGWETSAALAPLREEARQLVDWFADREPWGWKDPRNALVLPFWKSVIPGLRFVICVRSPLEVALSLNQRGRSSLRFGQWLWEEYYRRILAHTSTVNRIVTHYERGLEHPAQECLRLASFVGRPASEEAVRSMKPALRHQEATPDVRATIAVTPSANDLYEVLLRETSAEPVPPPPRWLREIAAEPELTTAARVDLTNESADVITRCLVPIERTKDGVIYEATSIDPQFELSLAPFAPSSVRAVRFRMRRDTNGSALAQLYWASGPNEDFSERRSTTVFLEPTDAGWREYRFRLDRPPVRELWRGGDTISRLRFDPANVQGRFELESLILEG